MSKEYMTAMSMIKCNGATAPVPIPIQCPISHGVISCKTHLPLLNANDCVPFLNVMTFGTCKMIPPTPAGPVPCIPALIMAWKQGDPHYIIEGAPVLTKDSFLTCTFGGTIKFQ
ncbi:MAG: DUF4280 domain-containing protein [Selenomonadaceae bacterium]|nr:DUF4280 domain-containing protein [Selenomonadaceae bacterium]